MGSVSACAAALLLLLVPLRGEDAVFAVGEWPPYTGAREPEQGGACAVVSAACAAAGLNAVFRFVPWACAEQEVLAGTAFATFPFQRVPDDPAFRYAVPLLGGTWRLYRHRANPAVPPGFAYGGIASLHGLRVARVLGYARINDDLAKAGITVDLTPDVDAAFRKLIALRVDIVIEDQAVGDAALARVAPEAQGGIGMLDAVYGEAAGSTYLVKASLRDPQAAVQLGRLEAGLQAVRAEGAYQRIVERFHMRPAP